jgi:hypothetical protein
LDSGHFIFSPFSQIGEGQGLRASSLTLALSQWEREQLNKKAVVSAPQPETTRTILTYIRSKGALRQGIFPAVSGRKINVLKMN